MSEYDLLDQAKKRERNRLWSLLTELEQEPPDIEQCTADGLHKRLRAYVSGLIAERNRLFHEVRCLRGEMVEREMQHETEIAGLRAQNERGPVWPDATQPHDFVGESSDCLCCGEGRLHYLHSHLVEKIQKFTKVLDGQAEYPCVACAYIFRSTGPGSSAPCPKCGYPQNSELIAKPPMSIGDKF